MRQDRVGPGPSGPGSSFPVSEILPILNNDWDVVTWILVSLFFLLLNFLNIKHDIKLKCEIAAKGGGGGGGGTTKVKSTFYSAKLKHLIFRNNSTFKYCYIGEKLIYWLC